MLCSVKILIPPPTHLMYYKFEGKHVVEQVPSEGRWPWDQMALGLRASQVLLLLLRTHIAHGFRGEALLLPLASLALTKDLFLENPFPVAGSLTLCLVG